MINAVLHCGLMWVNAVRTGSIRISIRNRNPCKNFEHDQNFFLRRIVLPESIRNWHGLRCGSIRAEPGRYGFNSVWTRFEIRLCVTAFPECIPHSKLFWPVSTRVDLHLIPDSPAPTLVDPQRQTSKKVCETGSSPCWTVSNRSDSYRPVLALFIFRWPTFKPYTKTVSI
jgi:hypothetical protein